MSKLYHRKDNLFKDIFKRRFNLLMAYHDLTLKDIALHTNSAISTVATWSKGRLPAYIDTVEKLAHLFKVRPEYLLKGMYSNEIMLKSIMSEETPVKAIDDLIHELENNNQDRHPIGENSTGEALPT